MKKFIISMSLLSSFTWLAFLSIGAAIAQNSVSVGVYAEHRGSKIVYHYRVINSGSSNIASVRIGYDSRNDIWELFELPSGWSSKIGIPPTSATSPPGWHVYMITPEEIPGDAINWGVIDSNSPRLQPGQILTGLSVTLDRADINYLSAHATINTTLTVPLERLDTTPPVFSITPTPATLWPPNGNLIPVAAAITVKDDYDPQL